MLERSQHGIFVVKRFASPAHEQCAEKARGALPVLEERLTCATSMLGRVIEIELPEADGTAERVNAERVFEAHALAEDELTEIAGGERGVALLRHAQLLNEHRQAFTSLVQSTDAALHQLSRCLLMMVQVNFLTHLSLVTAHVSSVSHSVSPSVSPSASPSVSPSVSPGFCFFLSLQPQPESDATVSTGPSASADVASSGWLARLAQNFVSAPAVQ